MQSEHASQWRRRGPMFRRAVAELSTSALLNNLNVVKRHCLQSQIIAMVKANSYGHGIRSVARRLESYVFALGVASLDEARALREHGITGKIILMEGVICPGDLYAVADLHLDMVVHDFCHLDWILEQQQPLQDVWVKVDIGMGRLGFFPEDLPRVMSRLEGLQPLLSGKIRLMGHFSTADHPQSQTHQAQHEMFKTIVDRYGLEASLCNSAAIFHDQAPHYEFVRPGLALYGSSPLSGVSAADLGLQPVMTVKSRLIAIKSYPKGYGIGYGHDYICARDMSIGVVSFGYGDGYPRSIRSGATILVDGHECEMVGRVSMDMMTVDLTAYPQASLASEVTIWGKGLPIERIEEYSGISRYELFTSVQNRVKFLWDR